MTGRFLSLLLLLIAAPLWAKPQLTVYTYSAFASQWGPGPKIKQAFEAECDCEVNFVALADGAALLSRLKMEGARSQADIVLGLDNNLLYEAEKSGLFTPHQIPLTALKLPVTWQNALFLPYDYSYFAFIYDSQRVKNPPRSFQALLDDKASWKILYEDPRTSTPGLGLLLWMQNVYGDQAPDAWRKLAAKTVTVTKGWSEAYGLFLKGEADLVLSYTTSPAYHLIEEHSDRYRAALFEDGHYLQIEVAGQLKNSPHPQLARRFMQFILTPAFQQTIPQGNWMYPVIDIPLPDAFAQLPRPTKTLQDEAQTVAEHRQAWTQQWRTAVSQ